MSLLPQFQLRSVLLLDAFTCLVMGVLLTVMKSALSPLTGVPVDILFYAGIALLPIAALMATVAEWFMRSSAAVLVIVVGNLLWVVGSVWLLLSPLLMLTIVGQVFVAVQAVVVAALALLEYRMLRSDAVMPAGMRI